MAVKPHARAVVENWRPDSSDISWTRRDEEFLRIGQASHEALFVGDSNMEQYYIRIKDVLEKARSPNRSAVFAVMGGCAPGVVDWMTSRCIAKVCARRFSGA